MSVKMVTVRPMDNDPERNRWCVDQFNGRGGHCGTTVHPDKRDAFHQAHVMRGQIVKREAADAALKALGETTTNGRDTEGRKNAKST